MFDAHFHPLRIKLGFPNRQTKVIAHPHLPHANSFFADQRLSTAMKLTRKKTIAHLCKSFSHKTVSRTREKAWATHRILQMVQSPAPFLVSDWQRTCPRWRCDESGNLAVSV